MKRSLFSVLVIGHCILASATHITGGEMFYTFLGVENGIYKYSVTLKLYQRCNSGRQFPNPTIISIFDKTNNTRVRDLSITINQIQTISVTEPDPCITNPPVVCYEIAYYIFQVDLPATPRGYVMASQVNYRINGITNLVGTQIGAMYTADIPGNMNVANAMVNNSARFTGSDLVIACANNDFTYSFAATDSDGDELRYYFCSAYASSGGGGGGASATAPPPFPLVPYLSPQFTGSYPLGNNVFVNSTTGLLTGIVPAEGIYVITVCVEEVRNGFVIGIQRKDVQINVAGCDIAAASLLPEYRLCGNSTSLTINNLSTSPLIVSYNWSILDDNGTSIFTSTNQSLTYTYPDTGTYRVKLVINPQQGCTDSTSTLVKVYPGFQPGFTYTGICINKQTQFTDQTTSVYGTPNSWQWDFGDPNSTGDVSQMQNPVYTYTSLGPKQVQLTVTDSKGCRDTINQDINIIDKPVINLGFRDTLICINDLLQLQASGNGNFLWLPNANILNGNTATPTVNPPVTTIYYVELENNGCKNRDSVRVRVVDHVTLIPMGDTSICLGDTARLRVVSDAFHFTWSPPAQVLEPGSQNPLVVTFQTTTYVVNAILGGCSATGNIIVTAVPYPMVWAGNDTTICFQTSTQLNGQTDGSRWLWLPPNSLDDPRSLNPVATPKSSTSYILSATDNRGCPKPSYDTMRLTVLPEINLETVEDTSVIIGQQLELYATGGISYQWSPATGLSDAGIPNPVVTFFEPSMGVIYKVIAFDEAGCRDSAYIKINVYATTPTVFVPAAFTPNNDGLNDILRPIAAGMKQIKSFSIYNRWGQEVFSTSRSGQGWDGRINGELQATNSYVWVVSAIDLNGKPYFQKGVVTLIR